MLRVDGVSPETKKRLQEAAMQLYGKPNASLLVRSLIAGHLSKSEGNTKPLTAANAGDTVRVELRLPRTALEQVNDLAEGRFSTRNYYLTSVILAHLGQPQLHGDEIEVLRRSNYELAKVGTNLNQVAKAFNTLVKMRGGEKLPEVGKKIASLRREIKEHTGKVLRILEMGTVVWEAKGGGQRSRKRK
ncbi:plasmid mobilization relaxosome protein MobC (plasmid) [Xylella taiwanensis]|nr:plasmid mobilization relaxosome protein MobC [Xylella taiwanensis]MCD8459804.1 plasmid mobilization relaxosome protein MobC [Xylella taiwanensis]UFN10326.1 plasmid mobilization relaxosome protein MobC [Xylella taiwanensis]UFN12614.1 plasmid mobilization relaxosome protein MobC [Xylella taiwanensis]UFS50794.1 plasmid mobilization relaxosome protein MobC [Xylella taiwanensis]UFS53086.1 plasmid mobilization relaxosome protein MobC [Xylella taiwanensis]